MGDKKNKFTAQNICKRMNKQNNCESESTFEIPQANRNYRLVVHLHTNRVITIIKNVKLDRAMAVELIILALKSSHRLLKIIYQKFFFSQLRVYLG